MVVCQECFQPEHARAQVLGSAKAYLLQRFQNRNALSNFIASAIGVHILHFPKSWKKFVFQSNRRLISRLLSVASTNCQSPHCVKIVLHKEPGQLQSRISERTDSRVAPGFRISIHSTSKMPLPSGDRF